MKSRHENCCCHRKLCAQSSADRCAEYVQKSNERRQHRRHKSASSDSRGHVKPREHCRHQHQHDQAKVRRSHSVGCVEKQPNHDHHRHQHSHHHHHHHHHTPEHQHRSHQRNHDDHRSKDRHHRPPKADRKRKSGGKEEKKHKEKTPARQKSTGCSAHVCANCNHLCDGGLGGGSTQLQQQNQPPPPQQQGQPQQQQQPPPEEIENMRKGVVKGIKELSRSLRRQNLFKLAQDGQRESQKVRHGHWSASIRRHRSKSRRKDWKQKY
uniref:Filaggrin-2-like n=1 Tax=Mesocestoides corti TaxID=53468 RepID=A0A5K3FL25_MESCO